MIIYIGLIIFLGVTYFIQLGIIILCLNDKDFKTKKDFHKSFIPWPYWAVYLLICLTKSLNDSYKELK